MKRRDVLKFMGAVASALPLSRSAWGKEYKKSSAILLDAVNFANKGGWKVDPQFIQQMGAPYLLAHGMGEPVENASTEIQVGEDGAYQLWVRTKDWCPGDWEAPGRFQVLIDGKANTTTFGTKAGWAWQKGSELTLKAIILCILL